jgi:protein phosphatase 1 regulatory subunit 7
MEEEKKEFVLDETLLSTLSSESFSEYSLVLQNARISRIGNDALEKTGAKLKSINLACNRISKINGLERLEDLRNLQLYNNVLTSLKGIGRNRRLETLHVHCNRIEEIPVEVNINLTRHPHIHIHTHSYTKTQISNLRMLKELRIGYNKLNSICYHLTHCRNLRHLDLCQNNIDSFEGISELRNLEILDVSRNRINTEALNGLKACSKLQELRLAHNRIESASTLKPLRRLITLDLSNNKIERMRDIPTLPNLSELYLSCNGLKDLGSRALKTRFPVLDTFDLSNNCIVDLSKVTNLVSDKNAPNLRELWIEGNEIVVMSGGDRQEKKMTCSDHISQVSNLLKLFPQLDALNGHSVTTKKEPALPRPISRRGVPSRNFLSREEICERAKMMRERFHDFRDCLKSLSKIVEPEIPVPPRRVVSRGLDEALTFSNKSPPRTILADTTTTTILPDTKTSSSQIKQNRTTTYTRPLTAPSMSRNGRDEQIYVERMIGGYDNNLLSTGNNLHRRPQTSRKPSSRNKGELRSFRIPPKAKTLLKNRN